MDDIVYTIKDISKMTGFSVQTVTRLFQDEPGVLVLRGGGPKRSYRSLRVPRRVYERVIRKYQQ
jgi:DNA-binding LacI/PurR family transcriptional regulator